METSVVNNTVKKNWSVLIMDIGTQLTENGKRHDHDDSFVADNYQLIREIGILTAMIPAELGGAGTSYTEMCAILKLVAHHCPSTALSLSMHQHLLAANIWKYRHNKGGEEILRKVAANNLILISTGAGDWLESNGTMEKVKGGYLVSAEKNFASQSSAGDILVTSAPYDNPEKGWQVLHFALPMNAEGVSVLDNWYTLGMRGTGSQTVKLDRVYVPETSVALERPKGEYHPFWNVVLTVAMPLIMSVYVGIAEKASIIALDKTRGKKYRPPYVPFLAGEMHNQLTMAQVVLRDMVNLANDLNFLPNDETAVAILSRKTLVADACKATVNKAMETVGGLSYYRNTGLERLFRDVQAVNFHPLQDKHQHYFMGEYLLNNQI